MPESPICPACGTRLADDPGEVGRPARCERCGAFVAPASAAWNPYAPPSAPLGGEGEGDLGSREVPPSVFGKFGLALRLFAENLALVTMIVLTVWLPANIAIDLYQFNAPADPTGFASIRLNNMVQGIFGPISLGALIFAVVRRMRREEVGYREAIGVGFGNWGRMFVANFFAGMFIILGLIALVVPGVILAIRYALLDQVVVLERAPAPRQRSTELTAGRRWQIVAAGLLFFVLFIPLSFATGVVIQAVQDEVEWLNNPWVNVAADCASDVVSSILTILMVLFYLEARREELARFASGPDDELFYPGKMSKAL